MRKTALRKKRLVSVAIFAVAVFCFFGKTETSFAYSNMVEVLTIPELPGGVSLETNTGAYLIRYLPTASILESDTIIDGTSLPGFKTLSIDGTSVKFTFSVRLKDEVDGLRLLPDNTIDTSYSEPLGGWDEIFKKNSDTKLETEGGTGLQEGHGIFIDLAFDKETFLERWPATDEEGIDGLYIKKYIPGDTSPYDTEADFISSEIGTGDDATSFIETVKNSEVLKFGTVPSKSDYEGSFGIDASTGAIVPDGFSYAEDLDTFIIKEVAISDLYPNTTYYAQIRIEEDIESGDNYAHTAFSTKIVKFTTGDGPVPEEGPVVTTTTVDGASTSENDPDWIVANLNCNLTHLLECIPLALYKFVYVPSAAILYFAGSMMDVFFGWTISSSIYRNSTFVVDGWRIVRDLCNIGFILALVFAAVQAILQMGGSIRRTVVSVIIIGLLINFSLFFSRVVIDAGNALARVFYNQITISGVSSGVAITSSDIEFKSLSQAVMDGMNIQKVISSDVFKAVNNAGWNKYSDEAAITIIVIAGIFLNVTAAWTFFLISWTFVGRIVGLWLAMIVSPIPFISRVMPRMGTLIGNNSMGAWFSNLLTLSFMAPIFIFLMYLLILMLESGFLSSLIKF